ncbi:hypothetical protein Tco_1368832 [Tanacetum coccineum]
MTLIPLIEITDGSVLYQDGAHGGFHMMCRLIFMSHVLIKVLINGGFKDSGHLPEILDQLPFSERKSVVKLFKIRTG